MKRVVTGPLKTIGHYRAQLGETPVWCARSQSLLWVDILAQRLLRHWPGENARIQIHSMPPFTSAVLLTTQVETFLTVHPTLRLPCRCHRHAPERSRPCPGRGAVVQHHGSSGRKGHRQLVSLCFWR